MTAHRMYLEATEKCCQQLLLMLPLEEEKRRALISDDTERMEKMLSEQQAAVMKLESLEQQRITAQNEAGFSGMRASEILEALPEDERAPFEDVFRRLRETAEQLRLNNSEATKLAKASLQFWESLEGSKPHLSKQSTYRTDGTQPAMGTSGTSLQIKI